MMNHMVASALFACSTGQVELSSQNPPRRILLTENFDERVGQDFASKALKHDLIELAEGEGPDGSDAIRVAYVGSERGSQRVVISHPFRPAVDQATLSFDVRFEENFQWVLGGKLHGLGPKRKVTGGKERKADRWSARMMFKSNGKCSSYLYDQEQKMKYGRGKTSENAVFTKGQWHHVAIQVSLNAPGNANGFLRILVDGQVVVASEEICFRAVGGADTQIQQLLFSTFHGGHTPKFSPTDRNQAPVTVFAYFDNFLVQEGLAQK